MKIVLDANILFSALIKNSKTRSIILNYEQKFLVPSFIFEEIIKYKKYLIKKSRMDEKEFELLLQILFSKLKIISKEKLIRHKLEAIKIAKDIDINDVLYFACALCYSDTIIWSNDKKLKNQNKIKILNTKDIIDFLS